MNHRDRTIREQSAAASPSWPLLALLLFLALFPEPARAASSLQLYPSGNGAFALRGENLSFVTAVGVTLRYDSTVDAPPRVTPVGVAAQAALEIKPDSAGTLEFSLDVKPAGSNGSGESSPALEGIGSVLPATGGIKPKNMNPGLARQATRPPAYLAGSTTLALITLPGPITNATGWVRNARGGNESIVVTYRNPPEDAWLRRPTPAPATSQPASVQQGESVVISLPSSRMPEAEPHARAERPVQPPTFRRMPAVSEEFMGLAGSRDAASLAELLSRAGSRQVRQEPALAVADGVTQLRLIVSPDTEHGELSSMLLAGASVVDVAATDEGGWRLDVLPKTGVCRASLTLRQGNDFCEFPLTVIPGKLESSDDQPGCPMEFRSVARELAGLRD
jgi:hypothetical protein